MRSHFEQNESQDFQIAPMVDVIFVLILFFMCSASSAKVENELSLKLPGRVVQSKPMPMLDEQVIEISESGEITLNNQKMDTPTLEGTLLRYKTMASDSQSTTVITILTAKGTHYQRIVDVLDACAKAHIESVTFTTQGKPVASNE